METTHNEPYSRKEIKNTNRASGSYEITSSGSMCMKKIVLKQGRKSRKKLFEKTMVENFTKLLKNDKLRDPRRLLKPKHKKHEENDTKSHPDLIA